MNCTRCEGTGFLNLHQVDDETLDHYNMTGDPGVILDWIYDKDAKQIIEGGCICSASPQGVPCRYCEAMHDVCVCDCCGDGSDWYFRPGEHDLTDNQCPFPECY